MPVIRAFIGLGITTTINQRLDQDCQQLRNRLGKDHHDRVRWIRPQNRHITLLFLGDTPLQACLEHWQRLTEHPLHPPSTCQFDQISHFPDAKSRIIALTESTPSGLLTPLKQAVDQIFSNLLEKPDGKNFKPHITLARIRNPWHFDFPPIDVDYQLQIKSLGLFQSHLTPVGSNYQLLKERRF
ncbi:RNA 2',3'-cyclic phosphodiesterase [Maricurvus nonylphenolicus]|uniref:RNA 2',3'-cyclic phosphodiesterase n=1 Tax=Maricurvus nonylphenolicus TaxID=1008307 RepID=UPI0036F1BBE8